MNIVKSTGLLFVLVSGLGAMPAFSDEVSVKILSPAEGAKLVASARNKITYDVTPGPRGDHTHLYVDGNEAAVLRKLKGDYDLKPLARGDHDICIRVVDKGHTPIGVERCVKVMAQ